ncbi:SGNH/GDSL hydrolase family protein [Paenibacillus tarimensis]|uniref:SGNH/GDSL hydrolase family protein n=1 Tax=Paenibacillus tarimensis TaxID=416012 RepID=UPI001F1C2FA3|nr:SGNH/GDSL hydrolase family protein [Paenibacillus tarimensis]MCF2945642.1 SGNH/GDSL hydrolase family protein [Paenibacillus tarimensis]
MPDSKTILFIGDSITDGARGRTDDPNHILGHGYVFMIAGRLGFELGGESPQVVNRGISGDRVSDLYARWNEDAISVSPDILSILVGVNDAWAWAHGDSRGATDRFRRAYSHLLEETREVLPETRIVLCEPFILKAGTLEENWPKWESRMKQYQEEVRGLAGRYSCLFVPLQELFDEACRQAPAGYWLWDGVHPTAAGHELIARQWLSVVLDNLDTE